MLLKPSRCRLRGAEEVRVITAHAAEAGQIPRRDDGHHRKRRLCRLDPGGCDLDVHRIAGAPARRLYARRPTQENREEQGVQRAPGEQGTALELQAMWGQLKRQAQADDPALLVPLGAGKPVERGSHFLWRLAGSSGDFLKGCWLASAGQQVERRWNDVEEG